MGEIRGLESFDCISYFSKNEKVGPDLILAGLFWSGDDSYAEKLSKIISKIREKQDVNKIFEEFKNFLRNPQFNVVGNALYDRKSVIFNKPREIFKNTEHSNFHRFRENEFVHLSSTKVGKSSDVSKKSGLAFLKFVKIEGGEVTKEKVWKARRQIMELYKTMTKNQKIKDYFSKVEVIEKVMREGLGGESYKLPAYYKLFGYLVPFDFANFEGIFVLSRARLFERKKTVEELLKELKKEEGKWNDFLFGLEEKLIEELLEELKKLSNLEEEALEDLREDEDKLKEFLLNLNGEVLEKLKQGRWKDILSDLKDSELREKISKKAEEEFINLLNQAFDKEFLKELRKEWKNMTKEFIKGSYPDLISGVFLERSGTEKAKISYGTFSVPNKEIDLFIFYEDEFKNELENFEKNFKNANTNFGKYTGNININIKKNMQIEKLIPFLEDLKKMDFSKPLKKEDAEKLLFSLLYFAVRMKNFVENIRKDKRPKAILLLLSADVRKDGESYPFWDYFRAVYDFFSVPVQTLNRPTIEAFLKYNKKEIQYIYKNLFISLMKDLKMLNLEYEGFELSEEDITVYAVLEKPSSGFCYDRSSMEDKPKKHYLLEVYRIDLKKGKAKVGLEDKFILLYGGVDTDTDRFRNWIEERLYNNIGFCFITAGKMEDSYVRQIVKSSERSSEIEKKSIFVEYRELPVAYMSEKAQKECFVIYSDEFNELKNKLGAENSKKVSLAIKPADVKSEDKFMLDDELFYHSAVQIFTTEGQGWEPTALYAIKKDLFLITLLALSQYESESFQTPYSKLNLWEKKKSIQIVINRNHQDYKISLNAVLYEMLYLISKIPVKSHENTGS